MTHMIIHATHRRQPTESITTLLAIAFCCVLLVAPGTTSAKAGELVMFRQAGCEWCEAWDEEIGTIYPKTEEGREWPIRYVDIHKSRPADLRTLKPVVFTPTFVAHENGVEVGRITGYTGEDFFWGLLSKIVEKTQVGKQSAKD